MQALTHVEGSGRLLVATVDPTTNVGILVCIGVAAGKEVWRLHYETTPLYVTATAGVAYVALLSGGIAQVDVAKGVTVQAANLTAMGILWTAYGNMFFSVSSDDTNVVFLGNGSRTDDGPGG